MNKKTNTILFIAAATIFNIATFFVVFLALMFLFLLFSSKLLADEGLSALATPLLVAIFIASIALSFLIYRLTLKFFLEKIDADKYFEPIFSRQKK